MIIKVNVCLARAMFGLVFTLKTVKNDNSMVLFIAHREQLNDNCCNDKQQFQGYKKCHIFKGAPPICCVTS